MVAGISPKLWEMSDMVQVLEGWGIGERCGGMGKPGAAGIKRTQGKALYVAVAI